MSLERHLQAIERELAAIRSERGEERVLLKSRDGWTREICVASGCYDIRLPVPLSMDECMHLWDQPITSIPGPPSWRERRFVFRGQVDESGKRIFQEVR